MVTIHLRRNTGSPEFQKNEEEQLLRVQWEPAKVNCKGWMITVWKPGTLPYDVMVWPNAIWARMRGNQGSVVSHRDSPRRVFYNAPWAQCGEMETEEERAEVQSCALPRRLSSKQRKPWQLDRAQSTSPPVTQTSLEGTIGTAIVLFHNVSKTSLQQDVFWYVDP